MNVLLYVRLKIMFFVGNATNIVLHFLINRKLDERDYQVHKGRCYKHFWTPSLGV